MRRTSQDSHGVCRSLLQKAVRRGDLDRVREVSAHLVAIGDRDWVRRRSYVILFEECWPLAAEAASPRPDVLRLLLRVASSEKNKDVAGLSALAFALSQGDRTVLDGGGEDRALRIVASGIARPDDFWKWADTQVSNSQAEEIVRTAAKAFRQGALDWDRALYIAASFLAVTEGVPDVTPAPQPLECRAWVGCDRHTREGRALLAEIAAEHGVSREVLEWIAFYCEGAVTNGLRPGVWWPREVAWRLKKIGIDDERAATVWSRVKSGSKAKLERVNDELERHLADARPQLMLGI